MARGHEAALSGAIRAIAKYGSRATMGDIALMSGIAKATLYNHFRTREELYDAVLIAEIDAAAEKAAAAGDLAAALAEAAELVATHPAVRKIAADEPALTAILATPGDAAGWQLARSKIVELLSSGGDATPAGVDLVLRYLASQLLAPTSPELRREVAGLLSATLSGGSVSGSSSSSASG
jgi:AcrR family transcriptional regulator